MTLTEFLQLNHEGRLTAANDAVCIGGRQQGKLYVLLCQLDGFYIEVFYDKKGIRIVNLVASDDTALLEPYLQKITVNLDVLKRRKQ